MQDSESLKDYLIADEILRIQTLSHKELVSELIDLKTKEFELRTVYKTFKKYD